MTERVSMRYVFREERFGANAPADIILKFTHEGLAERCGKYSFAGCALL